VVDVGHPAAVAVAAEVAAVMAAEAAAVEAEAEETGAAAVVVAAEAAVAEVATSDRLSGCGHLLESHLFLRPKTAAGSGQGRWPTVENSVKHI
jgi:hypothetical protein